MPSFDDTATARPPRTRPRGYVNRTEPGEYATLPDPGPVRPLWSDLWSAEREVTLDALVSVEWCEMYGYVMCHVRERGTLPPKGTIVNGRDTGRWLYRQRNTDLSEAQEGLLERIPGWTWQAPRGVRPADTAWAQWHQHLVEWVMGHDGFFPLMSENEPLARWIEQQQAAQAAGELSPWRVARLAAVPGWDDPED